jgi:hypothetical protein
MARDKKALTQQLVEQLPKELNIVWDVIYPLWWHNLRNGGGMRLTRLGYETFINHLDLEHYNFPVEPFDINSRLIVAMDRKLQMPYYIETKKMMPIRIVFFGSKEAVMANLYGGIKKFIDNYQP